MFAEVNLAGVALVITALGVLIPAAVAGWIQLRSIHRAVNSNHAAALQEIADLRAELVKARRRPWLVRLFRAR